MTARRYRVTGRVQGVGFRWFTRETARELKLRGTVRNAADGSVEVVAAGPESALDALGRSLRQGPPASRVEAVEEGPAGEDVDLPDEFRIIR